MYLGQSFSHGISIDYISRLKSRKFKILRKTFTRLTMKRTAPVDTDKSPSPKKRKTEPVNYPNIPIDADGLLSALLHPLDTETFMNKYWTKQVYANCINKPERVKDLLNGPFPFHLKTLLEETASDKIHVWMSSKQLSSTKKELLSFTVDDWESALSCYHCGGSLYFRAPPDFTDLFISSLMSDLGVGIGSHYANNDLRGEIEVFVSRSNHLTNWHYDFQHNFTLQLNGHKRWYLLPIDAENGSFYNVKRGNTPHFSNLNESDRIAKETQIKLHQSECANFDFDEWKKFDVEQKYKDKMKIIDLKPGSTMYFPAGCWHKVETVSDESLSINLSIVPMTYAELMSNAINHFMIKQPIFRQPILYKNGDNKDVLKGLCGKVKGFIDHIAEYPSCVVPCSFSNHSVSADCAVCVETFDFESIGGVGRGRPSKNREGSSDSESELYTFEKNEVILCHHLSQLYKAKVIKRRIHKSEVDGSESAHYMVHYWGWNAQWDEWVEADRCLKFTEENEQKQSEMKQQKEGEHIEIPQVICADDCFLVNPLSVMIKFDDVYEENSENNGVKVEKDIFSSFEDLEREKDEDEEEEEEVENETFVARYILHVNFGENDTFSSISRVILQCKNEETVKIIEWIRKMKSNENEKIQKKRFTVKRTKELMKDFNMTDDEIYHVLRVFAFYGWINKTHK